MRPDLCAKDCPVPPKDQIGRFWTDSLVHDGDTLDAIIKLFGSDKVCLGSDAPFVLGEVTPLADGCQYAAGHLIDSMAHWDEGLRDKVLGSNAMVWLHRRREEFVRSTGTGTGSATAAHDGAKTLASHAFPQACHATGTGRHSDSALAASTGDAPAAVAAALHETHIDKAATASADASTASGTGTSEALAPSS